MSLLRHSISLGCLPLRLLRRSTLLLLWSFSIGDVIVVDDLLDGPVEGASDFMDPPLSFDALSGFVSHSDNVHDSSFMDLSIFEYLFVYCDVTLYALFLPISQTFDIDDEITQHDSNDDSSSAFDSGPID